jgi:uncharacterized protein YukE
VTIALGRRTASQPAPQQPTGPQLSVDQVAQLLATVDPESFYRQADLVDGLVNHLQDTVDRYRNQLRYLEQAWGGVSKSQSDRLVWLGLQVDQLLSALREPSYATLFRQAGDAAAASKQRLVLLRQQQNQPAPTTRPTAPAGSPATQPVVAATQHPTVPTPAAALAQPPGHSDDDQKAQQILQDLSDAYGRVGHDFSPLPERTALGNHVPGLVPRETPSALLTAAHHAVPAHGSSGGHTSTGATPHAHLTRHDTTTLNTTPDAFLPPSVLTRNTLPVAPASGSGHAPRSRSVHAGYATMADQPESAPSTVGRDRGTTQRTEVTTVDTSTADSGTPQVNSLLSSDGVIRGARNDVVLATDSTSNPPTAATTTAPPPVTVAAGPTTTATQATGGQTTVSAVSHGPTAPTTASATTASTTPTNPASPTTPVSQPTDLPTAKTVSTSMLSMDTGANPAPAPAPTLPAHPAPTAVSGAAPASPEFAANVRTPDVGSVALTTTGAGQPAAAFGAGGAPAGMAGMGATPTGMAGGGSDLAGPRPHSVVLIAGREHWTPADNTPVLGREAPAQHEPGKHMVPERSDC